MNRIVRAILVVTSCIAAGISLPVYFILLIGVGMSPAGPNLRTVDIILILIAPLIATASGSVALWAKPKAGVIVKSFMIPALILSALEFLYVMALLMD